ncbi:MAG: sel1 repeat family protein [Pseudomonadota bacterium]|nr:sel1 repeat family protein [Pseudomonadota bacterium]
MSVSQATAEDGQAAFDAGHFGDALRIWKPLAEAGDLQAELDVGALYDTGQGVALDPSTAFHLYRRAAEAGLAEAQFNVAVMLDSGQDVPENRRQAAMWYARAAAQGFGRAAFDLAQLYSVGDGVPKNLDAARHWYQMAAGSGLTAAAHKLAALGAATPSRTETASLTGRRLQSPSLVWPPPSGTIHAKSDSVRVTLVWNAPAQPEPVNFSVELLRIEASGSWTRVLTRTADQTALMVQLAAAPGFYVWIVSPQSKAAGLTTDAYAYGWFTVAPEKRAISERGGGVGGDAPGPGSRRAG